MYAKVASYLREHGELSLDGSTIKDAMYASLDVMGDIVVVYYDEDGEESYEMEINDMDTLAAIADFIGTDNLQ